MYLSFFFFFTWLLFDFSTVLFYLRPAAPLTWGKGSIGGWSQRTSKAKALDRTWQWAWNWERISQRDQKKGTAAYQKHSLILVYWRVVFFFFNRYCLSSNHCASLLYPSFLFLWSAPVHILQRAQVIWPTGLFFRPQRCRCSERPHRLRFLSRQQIQHQEGAAGLRHPGYSHAAEQQRSDTMVLQQTSTRRYGRSPTDKEVILNTGLHSLYLNPAHTVQMWGKALFLLHIIHTNAYLFPPGSFRKMHVPSMHWSSWLKKKKKASCSLRVWKFLWTQWLPGITTHHAQSPGCTRSIEPHEPQCMCVF